MKKPRKRPSSVDPGLVPSKAAETAPGSVQDPPPPEARPKRPGRPASALNAEQAHAREARAKEEARARRTWRRVFREVGVDSEVGAFFAAKAARLSVIEERLFRAFRRRGVVNREGQVREGIERLMTVLRAQLEIVRYVADPDRGGWHLSSRRSDFENDSTVPETEEENDT